MRLDLENLPSELGLLHRLVRDMATVVETRDDEIDRLQRIVKQLQRGQFGRRSERLDPDQLALGIMVYMNSEAELAGVLGHEIGHVTARHSVRQQSVGTLTGLLGAGIGILTGSDEAAQVANVGGTALVRGYGRNHELEADRLGSEYLARVGYDPEEMIDVVEILKDQEEYDKQLAKEEGREPRAYHGTFSTHPTNDKRLQEVVKAANKFKTAATREPNREVFLNYINNVVVGDNEHDGIIRGNKFYHKEMNLFVEFPKGWKVDNLPDRLVAQPKEHNLQLLRAENADVVEFYRAAGYEVEQRVSMGKTLWDERSETNGLA